MKIKLVKRYYCNYCKTSKGTMASMRRHEEGCTSNPNRNCRMHAHATGCEYNTADFHTVLAKYMLKRIEILNGIFNKYALSDEDSKNLIYDLDQCPMCILTACKQLSIFISPDRFDYKKAVAEVWKEQRTFCEE